MITFRSEVGPDIMMFNDVAHRMMDLMGKERTERGVVTVEQLPETIARLKTAAAADRVQHDGDRGAAGEEDAEDEATRPVGLSQRIVPLIELLEISLSRGKPVTWGV